MRATNVNKAMRFASGTIKIRKKSASLILRKSDDESKYVGTFAMASFNKKTYVITAKNVAYLKKQQKKTQLFLQVHN